MGDVRKGEGQLGYFLVTSIRGLKLPFLTKRLFPITDEEGPQRRYGPTTGDGWCDEVKAKETEVQVSYLPSRPFSPTALFTASMTREERGHDVKSVV